MRSLKSYVYLHWNYFNYWNNSFMVRVQSWVRVDFISCRTLRMWILFVTWEKIVVWGCQNTEIQLRQKRHHLYEASVFPPYFKCLFLVCVWQCQECDTTTVGKFCERLDMNVFHYLFSVHAEHLAGGNITTEFISLIMTAVVICPWWLLFPADLKLWTAICNFIALYLHIVLRRTLANIWNNVLFQYKKKHLRSRNLTCLIAKTNKAWVLEKFTLKGRFCRFFHSFNLPSQTKTRDSTQPRFYDNPGMKNWKLK